MAADGQLRGLDQGGFVSRPAVHLGNVNELHPFRDGNGRTQRALFGQLAADAGWGLAWERMEPARNLAASRAAHHAQARDTRFRFVPRALHPDKAGDVLAVEGVRTAGAASRPTGVGALDQVGR